MSGFRRYGDGTLIQTTAAISEGSSGGGFFDEQGNLVGGTITTSIVERSQGIGFTVPPDAFRDLEKQIYSPEVRARTTAESVDLSSLIGRSLSARVVGLLASLIGQRPQAERLGDTDYLSTDPCHLYTSSESADFGRSGSAARIELSRSMPPMEIVWLWIGTYREYDRLVS